MRVQDRTSLGPSATEAGRTAESQKTGRENSPRNGAPGSSEGDRVELSSTLGRLSQAIAAHANERGQRVQVLGTDYQSGRYHPDAGATSRAMVAEALTSESR